ncbi:hypothetical protein L249_5726 [Ophiocordyceps polyrhachis-furcata BCC 54312]|uniref:Uncharacterized protein n=1 Tax=Ophiocordyceps polyrhachis-furcata BCC 54312 TaxID=1330021 RepID=A0A367L017_9HYPO|nr:hypothetical protein L249_5726 [Ophiocordyceps polyrhachis-furcata BCC 54312]
MGDENKGRLYITLADALILFCWRAVFPLYKPAFLNFHLSQLKAKASSKSYTCRRLYLSPCQNIYLSLMFPLVRNERIWMVTSFASLVRVYRSRTFKPYPPTLTLQYESHDMTYSLSSEHLPQTSPSFNKLLVNDISSTPAIHSHPVTTFIRSIVASFFLQSQGLSPPMKEQVLDLENALHCIAVTSPAFSLHARARNEYGSSGLMASSRRNARGILAPASSGTGLHVVSRCRETWNEMYQVSGYTARCYFRMGFIVSGVLFFNRRDCFPAWGPSSSQTSVDVRHNANWFLDSFRFGPSTDESCSEMKNRDGVFSRLSFLIILQRVVIVEKGLRLYGNGKMPRK